MSVLTYHNNNLRTGLNDHETILTPANVNSTTFGKLYTDPVDGQVLAQPLVLTDVLVPGQGRHNLVFVATEHDSVYAFDAVNGALIWHDSFLDPQQGVTSVPSTDVKAPFSPEVGITGTPVIDARSGTLYVVAMTKEANNGVASYVQRLHALNVATGAEKYGGPVVIADTQFDGTNYTFVSGASVAGTGSGSINGQVTFNAARELQRSALLLVHGVVYIAWASFSDIDPYHGWVLGYNAHTLKPASGAVFNDTPNGVEGGIWMAGNGLAADAQGDIYFSTGNGTFDANTGGNDYGDTIVKLSTHAGLSVADYFTPSNQAILGATDGDLGSGGVMLVPAQAGAHPEMLIQAGKQGTIYVVNPQQMGRFDPNADHVWQELPHAVGGTGVGAWSSPAYFDGTVYYNAFGDVAKAFRVFATNTLSPAPVSAAAAGIGYPGASPSISANGNKNGIVWTIQVHVLGGGTGPAILHAYDAGDLSRELYNSSQAPGSRDNPGQPVEFGVPTVANGRVYMGTQTGLVVFGLLPRTPLPAGFEQGDIGAIAISGAATSGQGTFNIAGSGAGFTGISDSFHYVFQALTGDAAISARLDSLINTNSAAAAGVMLRATIGSGSMDCVLVINPAGQSLFEARTALGANTANVAIGPTVSLPVWLKLVRTGNVVTAFESADGTSWTQIGAVFLPLPAAIYVGMGVASGTNAASTTAIFDQVSVTTQAVAGDIAIDAGGGTVGSYLADTEFTSTSGGTFSTTATINTSGVTDPAPQPVYKSQRQGTFTYTLTHLEPDKLYNVRLHFAELSATKPGQREFNVAINGQQVLTNFDVFAAAGGADKPVIQTFPARATSQGEITVQFLTAATGVPILNGLEAVLANGHGNRLTAAAQDLHAAPNRAGTFQVASFTDTAGGSRADFSALINWGDGHSSIGTVRWLAHGTFEVTGNHKYAHPGIFAVIVHIHDKRDGLSVSVQGTANV